MLPKAASGYACICGLLDQCKHCRLQDDFRLGSPSPYMFDTLLYLLWCHHNSSVLGMQDFVNRKGSGRLGHAEF